MASDSAYRRFAGLAILGGWLTFFAGAACVREAIPGVPRAARVNPEIYRGGQPSLGGFQNLAKKKVQTVLDLRKHFLGAIRERVLVQSLGMRYVQIPMSDDHLPRAADVQKALSVLEDSSQGPVFVHCEGGKDRTGMVIACYRIAHDHWSNERALEEARSCASRNPKHAMRRWILQFKPGK